MLGLQMQDEIPVYGRARGLELIVPSNSVRSVMLQSCDCYVRVAFTFPDDHLRHKLQRLRAYIECSGGAE